MATRPGLAVAIVAAVVGAVTGCAPGPPVDGLRVMTWNVQTGVHDPAEWAPTIAAWQPDVVGLQEICAGEAEALAAILRRDHGLTYTAVPGPIRPVPAEDAKPINAALRRPCRDGALVQYGLAVLSRLPVTAATTVLYAPDDRDEQRGYQRVVLGGRTPVVVYNTHVGLAGVQDEQIRGLAAAAGTGTGPIVVLGDLNVDESGALGPLRERFAEVDPAGAVATQGDRTIDHVFFRDLTAASSPRAPEVASSDHRPLIGDLRPAAGG